MWCRKSGTFWLAVVACLSGPSTGSATDKPEDLPAITRAVNIALETAKTGSVTRWQNPETGSNGIITIERTYLQADQTPCREYVRQTNGTPALVTRGTGCRADQLKWDLTEASSEPPPAGPAAIVPAGDSAPIEEAAAPTPLTAKAKPVEKPPVISGSMPSRSN